MTFWSGLMIGMWIGGFIGFAVAGVFAAGAIADAEAKLGAEIKRLRGCRRGLVAEDLPNVNVAAFGAVGGDGITDDTVAIQAALDSSPDKNCAHGITKETRQ